MDNMQIVATLNPLIAGCRDAQLRLLAGADLADEEALRRMLLRRAAAFGRAAGDLAEIVCDFGGEPRRAGGLGATLQRVLLEFRTFLLASPDEVLIEDCARVENAAMARCRAALDAPLPPTVRKAVLRQFEGSQRQQAAARALRGSVQALLRA